MRPNKPFTMPSDEELAAGDEADLLAALAATYHDWRYQTGADSHESDPPTCVRWARAALANTEPVSPDHDPDDTDCHCRRCWDDSYEPVSPSGAS